MKNKQCPICKVIKSKTEFGKYQQKCKSCKDLYKCCICKEIKNRNEFRSDSSRSSGISSRCKLCGDKNRIKNSAYYERRRRCDRLRKNTPIRKLRYFFKDVIKRLHTQKKDTTWNILGFTKEEFIKKFPEIPKGYHIDHCIPISWFEEFTPISISCALENLQIILASENISKSNHYADINSCEKYFEKVLPYIKERFKENYLLCRAAGRE
jgi:hypothetical protein